MPFIDHLGKTYGRLTVLSRAPNNQGDAVWNCVCICGNTAQIFGFRLGKHTNSCGCLKREVTRLRMVVDNRSKHPLHQTWHGMLKRCYNVKNHNYKYYGARGISVCDEWREDFFTFVRDMGARPSLKHTVERVDNNGNYTKSNCVWATAKTQAANRRKKVAG